MEYNNSVFCHIQCIHLSNIHWVSILCHALSWVLGGRVKTRVSTGKDEQINHQFDKCCARGIQITKRP